MGQAIRSAARRAAFLFAAGLLACGTGGPTAAAAAEDAASAASVPAPAAEPAASAATDEQPPGLLMSRPYKLVFEQPVGSKRSARVVVTASAASAINLTDIHASGDFTTTTRSCALGKTGSCSVDVVFEPKEAGDSSSALTGTLATGESQVIALLEGKAIDQCSWHCGGFQGASGMIVLCIAFFAALVFVRWNLIAVPTRRLLHAELDAVQMRLDVLAGALPQVADTIARLGTLLAKAREEAPLSARRAGVDALVWSRGQEAAGWGLLHEVEAQLAAVYPEAELRAQLEQTTAELQAFESPVAHNLAARIDAALAATRADVGNGTIAAVRELQAFLAARDPKLAADVEALATAATPTALADYAPAARRAAAFLAQWAPLEQRMAQVAATGAPTRLAEFLALVDHVRSAVIPALAPLQKQLADALAANPAPDARAWAAVFNSTSAQLAATEQLARRVEAAFAALPQAPVDRWRALLGEGLGMIYERRDRDFDGLTAWHNKTSWLTSCGLVLIAALAVGVGNSPLFLLGATGGLLSRLSRSLYRQDVPTDYGASWTTLFLSPVVGAITGWCGVLVIALLLELKVLGPALDFIHWDAPCSVAALAMALMFGFSERAFDTVLSQLQDKVLAKSEAPTSPAAPLSITTPASLRDGQVGKEYDASLTASGGKPPVRWSVVSGALPSALALDEPSGRITGKPASAGVFRFTIQAKDANGTVKSQACTLTVK